MAAVVKGTGFAPRAGLLGRVLPDEGGLLSRFRQNNGGQGLLAGLMDRLQGHGNALSAFGAGLLSDPVHPWANGFTNLAAGKAMDRQDAQDAATSAAYQNAVGSLPGLPTWAAPLAQADPNFARSLVTASLTQPAVSSPRPMTAAERAQWGIPAEDARVWAMDPATGTPSVIGGNPPSSTSLVVGPDGTVTYGQGVSGAGATPNLNQSNAALYASRMTEANDVINRLQQVGTSYAQAGLQHVPIFGNSLVSSDYQQLDQAERNFMTAVLRRESGAAISQTEYDQAAKVYFPQPGDSAEVLARKAQARATAIAGIQNAAGPAPMISGAPAEGGTATAASSNPAPEGTIVQMQDGSTVIKRGGQWVPYDGQ